MRLCASMWRKWRFHPVQKAYFDRIAAGEDPDTDDMKLILQSILESPIVVFSTPLYYFGMSAQLKTVVDRFNSKLSVLMKKADRCDPVGQLWRQRSLEHERLDHPFRLHLPAFCIGAMAVTHWLTDCRNVQLNRPAHSKKRIDWD